MNPAADMAAAISRAEPLLLAPTIQLISQRRGGVWAVRTVSPHTVAIVRSVEISGRILAPRFQVPGEFWGDAVKNSSTLATSFRTSDLAEPAL